MNNIYMRQNDEKAIVYLKASYYCGKRSKQIAHFIILISILICLAGMLNKYFDKFARLFLLDISSLSNIKNRISEAINFASGLIIIINMFLTLYSNRLHIDSVNILELFDAYIFELPINQIIIRPITEASIYNYANKVRKKSMHFFNHYFQSSKEIEDDTTCFKHQLTTFDYEYRLMLFIKPFFITLWTSFAVLIFLIALSFNENFFSTLTNVLFPSLSILSLISSSSHSFGCRLKTLQHCTNVMQGLNCLQEKKKNNNMLRYVQDGVYNLRINDFNIPQFLEKRFKKLTLKKQTHPTSKKRKKATRRHTKK